MKLAIKVGDMVKVTQGKFSGKEAKVVFIDKKNYRLRLEGLKQQKLKTKKGAKDVHGTFHLSSVVSLKPVEAPVEAQPAETPAPAPAAAATPPAAS